MTITFRARVGSQRISGSMDPSQAGYTRDIRAQMKDIEKEVTRLCNTLKGMTPEVLMDALTPTYVKALSYTPIDTGDLRQSGFLVTRVSGDKIQAEIGFGKGGFPHYAVYVHEMVDIPHTAPTRSKFLQAAIEEDLSKLRGRIYAAYKKRIRL